MSATHELSPQPEHRDRRGISDRRSRQRAICGRTSTPRSCKRARCCWPSGSSRRCTSRWSRSAPASAGTSRRRRTEIRIHPPADHHPGARERPAPGGRRHASLRPVARPGDLPRRPLPHDRGRPEDGGARQPDLRPARPHRRGGSRNGDSTHERRALFPAAHPGAVGQLAVLAGHGHGPAILSLQGVRQVPAHQHPGPVSELVRNSKTTSTC